MIYTIEEQRETLKRLERAFVGAVSSALNYDSKEWVFNDQGKLHAVSATFLNGSNNHDNGSIALALAQYQSSQFEPVALSIPPSSLVKNSVGEHIYFEYNSKTGSFLVPSKKQIKERSGDVDNNINLANSVENTHFNASLFVSKNFSSRKKDSTLHLVFRGTEQGLDSVATKYGVDAYTDLDKYHRQMEVFEKAIFQHIENNPNIKEFTVTGHSLGGAMAQFFHEKHRNYFEKKGINFYATTFGSPGADMKGWFSTLKDKFREFRKSIDFHAQQRVIISDIATENASHAYYNDFFKLINPDNSIFETGKALISIAINITNLALNKIASSFHNKVGEIVNYNYVNEKYLFKNNDTAENKANYAQEHYYHKYDPIPMVGGLAYDANGKSFKLDNHIRQQKGANKFFKKIMGEHTSDAYIHNIVNEIYKIYESNPKLKYEMFKLNPAFREYVDGYNTINKNKEKYQSILEAHPEFKESLQEYMYIASKPQNHNRKTMAGAIAEYKDVEEQVSSLLTTISTNISSYSKQIEPIFTTTKLTINGQEIANDYKDIALPDPQSHNITKVSQAINKDLSVTLFVDPSVNIIPMSNKNLKVEYNLPIARKPEEFRIDGTKILIQSYSIPPKTLGFLDKTTDCVAECCATNHTQLINKLTKSNSSGNLDSFLFDKDGECNLQPQLNISQYNVRAVQSFNASYTGDKRSLSEYLADTLGFGKSSAPSVVDSVISKSQEIASFGAPVNELKKLSKDFDDLLKKPSVIANMKKVIEERSKSELIEIQKRNTFHIS